MIGFHALKSWPDSYTEIVAGLKKFEVRSTDERTFEVGDFIMLHEYDPDLALYTGRAALVRVTSMLRDSDVPEVLADQLTTDVAIMSIRLVEVASDLNDPHYIEMAAAKLEDDNEAD